MCSAIKVGTGLTAFCAIVTRFAMRICVQSGWKRTQPQTLQEKPDISERLYAWPQGASRNP